MDKTWTKNQLLNFLSSKIIILSNVMKIENLLLNASDSETEQSDNGSQDGSKSESIFMCVGKQGILNEL